MGSIYFDLNKNEYFSFDKKFFIFFKNIIYKLSYVKD